MGLDSVGMCGECQESETAYPGGVALQRFGSITFHVIVLCDVKNFLEKSREKISGKTVPGKFRCKRITNQKIFPEPCWEQKKNPETHSGKITKCFLSLKNYPAQVRACKKIPVPE